MRCLAASVPAARRAFMRLRGSFSFNGHYVLVLDRLHGSLLDYLVDTTGLGKPRLLANLRKVAVQLLVRQHRSRQMLCCCASIVLPSPAVLVCHKRGSAGSES